ncbi:MAG: hypothetical protein ABFR53_11680 [Actinomycetota bacterium]
MTDSPAEEPSDSALASGDDRSVDSHRPLAARSLAVIAGLVLVGVLLNSMLWYISRPAHRGLIQHDDVNLSTLVVTEQRALRLQDGFAAYLHDLARQGVITVPDASVIDQRKLENLAQMTVNVDDYDYRITQARIDSLDPGVEIGELGLVGKSDEPVAYWFLMRDESLAPSVTYFTIGSHVYIIDDRLLGP